ncbi:MAG TPA: DUF2914 domain-containing protein [Vicinamibacterales bacterium]|nr:DUF2914 domain-containing protein [Vicinamibacterales bacterium]
MPESAQVRYALESAEQSAAAGDFPTAAQHLREAVALQEAQFGAFHPDVASTLNNLGVVCERIGQFGEAEACYRRAYAIVTAARPADDPLVATSRQNLADFCAARGIPFETPVPSPPSAVTPAAAPVAEPLRSRRSNARRVPLVVAGIVIAFVLVRWLTASRPAPDAAPPGEIPPPASTPAPAPPVAIAPVISPAPPTPTPARPKPAAPKPDGSSIGVAEAQLCRTLTTGAEWKCTKAGDAAGPGGFYFYTRLTTPRDTVVVHRWYREERVMQSRELQIHANPGAGYRTYSRFTIDAAGAGHWRVELLTADGHVLHEERFVVR